MREVPPTNRSGRNLPGSDPRAREGVTVSNPIDIKDILVEIEEKGRKGLVDALSAPVDEVTRAVFPNAEEASPVADSSAAAKEEDEVSDVASGEGGNGKGHAVDGRYCRNKNNVMVRKRKGIYCEKHTVVYARAHGGVGVIIADDVSEGTLIAKDRSGVERATNVLILARSRASQATDKKEVVGRGKNPLCWRNPLRLTWSASSIGPSLMKRLGMLLGHVRVLISVLVWKMRTFSLFVHTFRKCRSKTRTCLLAVPRTKRVRLIRC